MLGRLLEEISATRQGGSPSAPHLATSRLAPEWTDDGLEALQQHAQARVLVVDGAWQAAARLPSTEWLVKHGGAGAAAEEAIGSHAAKCFVALGKDPATKR